ncbi:hypothetical protein DIPPA_32982 [Diplonema papillatum]|nr:hypothetical protein DIPPA_32982 [Diplonema papillatum]
MPFFEIYTNVVTPLFPFRCAVEKAGGTVLDKHAEVGGEARIVIAGSKSMEKLLKASLLSVQGFKSLCKRGAYVKGSRKESPTIQLHLVSPGGDWAPFSDAIMQAAARIITRYAQKKRFPVQSVYPYAVAVDKKKKTAAKSLQINVGNSDLAAAMCDIKSLAFDSTQLFVPGCLVYASSLQIARKDAYQHVFDTYAAFTHDPYSSEHNALNRIDVPFTVKA